jgi:glycosyltransferase involved in cell wall biosynthesis
MNSSQPRISVLLSVFNSREYLCEAIDSVLRQTFKDFELIIIDDASDDGSSELIDNYRSIDNRIIVIRNRNNLGLAESLNRGLKVASGSFIARMDADDMALPNRFELQIKFLEHNPTISLVGSDTAVIDTEGNELGENRAFSDPELLRRIIVYRTISFHPTWLFRRELAEQINGYRDFPVCQDYDFLLRAIESGARVSNYPGVLLRQRRYSGISNRKSITVRKTTEYILSLRRERQLTGGSDSYSRERAYRSTRNHFLIDFTQELSQRVLAHASISRFKNMRARANFYYGLSCLLSFEQTKLFVRILRSWFIIRSWPKSQLHFLYSDNDAQ